MKRHIYAATNEPRVGVTEWGAAIRKYRCACGKTVSVTAEQLFWMRKGECVGG